MATTISPIKILSDLGLNPWEIENDEDYLRALKEGIITIEAATKGKGDRRSEILREELIRVRKGPKKTQVKEKKSTIKGAKLLPGTTFRPEDIKPVDVEKKGDAPALMPDRLDNIAKTVESIALLLRRQLGLEKKQQRDSRKQQDKINKDAREDKLEGKPKDKKTGLIPKSIAKPALGFFEKLKRFFLNIVIGAGVVKLFDWLKDPANVENVTKFKDFLINNAGWILGGLAAIALLPIALTLVNVIAGVIVGLSLLGAVGAALPVILKGILIGAVAWWVGKKISRAITGGKVIGGERHKNLKRLEAAGITGVNRGQAFVADENNKKIMVNTYGKNSITGVEWDWYKHGKYGHKEDDKQRLNLIYQSHRDWYAANYGQQALDEKMSAIEEFKSTKSALVGTKKDMQKALTEARKKHKREGRQQAKDLFDNAYLADERNWEKSAWFRSKDEKEWKKKFQAEWAAKEAAIRKKYGDQAIGITEAVIDKDVKSVGKEIPLPQKSKGKVSLLPGVGDKKSSGVGSGGGGEDSSTPPKFSSTDPNNLTPVATMAIYNMAGN